MCAFELVSQTFSAPFWTPWSSNLKGTTKLTVSYALAVVAFSAGPKDTTRRLKRPYTAGLVRACRIGRRVSSDRMPRGCAMCMRFPAELGVDFLGLSLHGLASQRNVGMAGDGHGTKGLACGFVKSSRNGRGAGRRYSEYLMLVWRVDVVATVLRADSSTVEMRVCRTSLGARGRKELQKLQLENRDHSPRKSSSLRPTPISMARLSQSVAERA
ncbi:hypothetical protein R3P38DRAFT_2809129 [Favolaschia claudopus]|uniref:Uncharacterized protein n=1 Tax=Favolaschia claudopus TaxID=2862362 RepID=A0AAV9ZER1_9AGAR